MHRLMVVDDEIIIAMQLEGLLKRMDYDVVGIASEGEEAVRMSKSLSPDLVLMDIVMPGEIDGIAAAEKIREKSNIPIIFLTAYAEEELINRAKCMAPHGYILKPFKKEQIKAAIDIALYKKDMEEALRKSHEELERRVEDRTAELSVANKKLRDEIEMRKQSEEVVRKREAELEIQAKNLEEANAALGALLIQVEANKAEIEEKMLSNVKELIRPYLQKIRRSRLDERQKAYLDILESNLNNIISPFSRKLSARYLHLTPTEIQVADLVKDGKSTKEIADLLNSSISAISFHRKSIRKKLGLKDKETNLRSHLLSIQE